MATMVVKNASGGDETVEKPLPPSRAAAASSRPVALSTEDLAAINAITAKLIAGPATETTLAAILSKLIAAPATEANQEALNLLVDGVEAALASLNSKDFATQTTLAAILAKIIAAPATEATQLLIGTRAYGTTIRVAVGSASAQSAAIASTEVMLHAKVACFVKNGADPTAVVDGDSIPLEAGEKFHMRITSGHKIAVIREGEDGFLFISPVV